MTRRQHRGVTMTTVGQVGRWATGSPAGVKKREGSAGGPEECRPAGGGVTAMEPMKEGAGAPAVASRAPGGGEAPPRVDLEGQSPPGPRERTIPCLPDMGLGSGNTPPQGPEKTGGAGFSGENPAELSKTGQSGATPPLFRAGSGPSQGARAGEEAARCGKGGREPAKKRPAGPSGKRPRGESREEAVAGRVVGYLRVSTAKQDVASQRMAVLEWANSRGWRISLGPDGEPEFISVEMSSRKSLQERRIEELFERLGKGDTLLVTELSRLGRSGVELDVVVSRLLQAGIRLRVLKPMELDFVVGADGTLPLLEQAMKFVLGLGAQLERDLVRERTNAGLARARAEGRVGGRKKGKAYASRLEARHGDIVDLLGRGLGYSAVARYLGEPLGTVRNYCLKRGLRPLR